MKKQIYNFNQWDDILNESNNMLLVYHSGYIVGDIKPPFYVTDNDFGAESYGGDELYKFNLNLNSKILDLTNINIFKNIKMKIYDNNSKLFIKYINTGGFGGYSKDRAIYDYNILKQFKNFHEIVLRYNNIKLSELFEKIFDYGFNGYYDDISILHDYYLSDDVSKSEKNIINEFEILHTQVRNIDRLDDFGLNMFGSYFFDYAKNKNYDAYNAWSSDASGRMRIIEYCIINTNIINEI